MVQKKFVMQPIAKSSLDDPLLEASTVSASPFRAIHHCLEHIWQRFHLRSRLFILEGDHLILRDCVGDYSRCPEIGLRVHPESVVWQIFKEGNTANLTKSNAHSGRAHSLPEPVHIKAVIPLPFGGLHTDSRQPLGVLVVDSGDLAKPVEDRDFQYLEVLGMLISEILERFALLQSIQKIQSEKERLFKEVADIMRNRFAVIGGFARRLRDELKKRDLKDVADIILEEVQRGESALKQFLEASDP